MKKIVILGAALALVGPAVSAPAAVLGTDNTTAAVYADGWGSGDNGVVTGNAFGPWTLATATLNGGFAGHFIGNSTGLDGGNGANINTGGNAFGMYGNSGPGAVATAARSLNGTLDVGQTFSVDLAVNFRNGNKGLDVRDANGATIFNFNVGGDVYAVNNALPDGSIGNDFSTNTAFRIALTQTSAAGGTWTVTRSGGVSDLDTGTYAGVAAGLNLYVAGTNGGDANNLFANNLSVVPEPAGLAVLGLAAVGLLRRRK